MRRCSPRFWRVLSFPWLVSANVHAAAVLLLMCTLAPREERGSRDFEIVLGDAVAPTEIEAVEMAVIEPPPELDAAPLIASPGVREIDVASVAAMNEAADRARIDDRTSLAGALPAAESLLTRVSRPWGQAGLSGAGTAGGVGGAGNQAAFFGTTAFGRRFVYILDMSGSMKEGGDGTAAGCRFRRAAEELLASVDRLSPDQVFYVYLFSTTTRPLFDEPPLNPVWRPATPEVKSLLRAWLASVEPGGGTDPRLALQLAAVLRPDALFVLSDGRFSGKEQKIVRGLEQSDRARERGAAAPEGIAPIHTFAFEDALACHSLQTLALATGGVYRFVPPIFRQGKRDKSPPIKDEVYAENLLKTAESLQRAGRSDEALEVHRILARDFPDTPAAQESAERLAALAEMTGES